AISKFWIIRISEFWILSVGQTPAGPTTLKPHRLLGLALLLVGGCTYAREVQEARSAVKPGQSVRDVVEALDAKTEATPLRMYCNAGGVLVFQAHRPGRSGGYSVQTRRGDQECGSRDTWLAAIQAAASEQPCESLQVMVAGVQSFTVSFASGGRASRV